LARQQTGQQKSPNRKLGNNPVTTNRRHQLLMHHNHLQGHPN
jgi:hypothetical protein